MNMALCVHYGDFWSVHTMQNALGRGNVCPTHVCHSTCELSAQHLRFFLDNVSSDGPRPLSLLRREDSAWLRALRQGVFQQPTLTVRRIFMSNALLFGLRLSILASACSFMFAPIMIIFVSSHLYAHFFSCLFYCANLLRLLLQSGPGKASWTVTPHRFDLCVPRVFSGELGQEKKNVSETLTAGPSSSVK